MNREVHVRSCERLVGKYYRPTHPYALNIAGKPVITTSKQEAVAVVRHHLDQGRSNIDLGVMQLNFYWHGKYFKVTNSGPVAIVLKTFRALKSIAKHARLSYQSELVSSNSKINCLCRLDLHAKPGHHKRRREPVAP